MKELNDHIESIIARSISGEITTEERGELNEWMAANSNNAKYVQDLEKLYAEAVNRKTVDFPKLNVDQEWHKFKNTVQLRNKSKSNNRQWLQIAAAITLVTTLGYVLWFNVTPSDNIKVVAEYSGQLITLPDSSVVTLNKNAELSYPTNFLKTNRSVALSGEAFFEVKKNKKKPFIIKLNQSKVEVLGTSFNINSKDSNNKIEVVVNTGKVKFTSTESKESVILTKGEKGTLMMSNKTLLKEPNQDVNFMAWKTRKIIFSEMELDEVIKILNKLYEAKISFSTDVSKNCEVTVSFDNQSLSAILSVLEVTLNLEYKKTDDIIEIIKTGC